MSQKAQQLLLELLMLKVKYEQTDFQKINQLMENKDPFLTETLEYLEKLNALKSKKQLQVKERPETSHSTITDDCRTNDPQKYELLHNIETLLKSKEVFPVKKELQAFVGERVKLTRKNCTIQELITLYVNEYKGRKIEELQQEYDLLVNMRDSGGESSFLKMANEIVNSRRKGREAKTN